MVFKDLRQLVEQFLVLDLGQNLFAVVVDRFKDVILAVGLYLLLGRIKNGVQRVIYAVFIFNDVEDFKGMLVVVVVKAG